MQTEVTNSSQWRNCLQYMFQRVNEQSYNTWLKPTVGSPDGDDEFVLGVPNQFVADWINSHFSALINEAFLEVLGKQYVVHYQIHEQMEAEPQVAIEFDKPEVAVRSERNNSDEDSPHLSNRYRFKSLVVGDFNEMACAASMAVADAPGTTRYNPLFIYGGTGLGKTHILQSIGHRIQEQFPNKRVVYATSEEFTSDFITSISEGSVSQFTRMYRNVDALLIDDIQFLTGKESTQEQFFHTFNSLYHYGKQIVLTSDRPPREIKDLEERLLSRFSWGLVCDLQAPDLENRMAILYKKLESEGIELPDDVIRFMADRVTSNIRELEGALIRLLAYASLKQSTVDINLARKLLSDSFSNQKKQVTIAAIQKTTAEHFDIETAMMKAKKKTSHIALARQVAMYLSRSLTSSSLKVIGGEFGGRDHSTVIHACDMISKKMAVEPSFRERIDQISASLLY
ncbi:MAG: chromosomal replication initiator protein DnaA [candidate division Zixibacteria bacterium]|nr:chromosomal replication initiator protein DnaA [candidate division Zixibacteria bacterium]